MKIESCRKLSGGEETWCHSFSFLFLPIVFRFQNSICFFCEDYDDEQNKKKSDADFWVSLQKYVITAAHCWVCSVQTYSIKFVCTGPKKIVNFT